MGASSAYREGMTATDNVLSASDARKMLNSALDRFRREGAHSEPVVFGSHRKPEAVLIPYARYQQLLVDIAGSKGVELEYEGPLRSFTTARPMGALVDIEQAMRLLNEVDDAEFVRQARLSA